MPVSATTSFFFRLHTVSLGRGMIAWASDTFDGPLLDQASLARCQKRVRDRGLICPSSVCKYPLGNRRHLHIALCVRRLVGGITSQDRRNRCVIVEAEYSSA